MLAPAPSNATAGLPTQPRRQQQESALNPPLTSQRQLQNNQHQQEKLRREEQLQQERLRDRGEQPNDQSRPSSSSLYADFVLKRVKSAPSSGAAAPRPDHGRDGQETASLVGAAAAGSAKRKANEAAVTGAALKRWAANEEAAGSSGAAAPRPDQGQDGEKAAGQSGAAASGSNKGRSGEEASSSEAPPRQRRQQQNKGAYDYDYQIASEIKRPGKFYDKDNELLDLIAVYNKPRLADRAKRREWRSIRRIVQQVYTYMVFAQVEMAWVSCYTVTWLAWRPRDRPNVMLLSRPIFHNTSVCVRNDVTTMAAMAWQQDESTRLFDEGLRHKAPSLDIPGVRECDTEDEEEQEEGHDPAPPDSSDDPLYQPPGGDNDHHRDG